MRILSAAHTINSIPLKNVVLTIGVDTAINSTPDANDGLLRADFTTATIDAIVAIKDTANGISDTTTIGIYTNGIIISGSIKILEIITGGKYSNSITGNEINT